MKCNICKVNDAVLDPYYGYLPCKECQEKQAKLKRPGSIPEFVGENIKEGRKQYWHDIHGAHRKGVPSREFRDQYGKESMKRQGFTDKEIDKAQYVWNDDRYYKEGN